MRKMNRATPAILAVLFGLATVLVFRWSLQKREAESAAAPAQVDGDHAGTCRTITAHVQAGALRVLVVREETA